MTHHDKFLFLIPPGAKTRTDWRGRPPAETTHCNGEHCTVELPKEKSPGSLKIECRDCPAWAMVEVQGSVDDPRTFTMPCGRVHQSLPRSAASLLNLLHRLRLPCSAPRARLAPLSGPKVKPAAHTWTHHLGFRMSQRPATPARLRVEKRAGYRGQIPIRSPIGHCATPSNRPSFIAITTRNSARDTMPAPHTVHSIKVRKRR